MSIIDIDQVRRNHKGQTVRGTLEAGAVYSTCELYRYLIWRTDHRPLLGEFKSILWIMLNPSTATEAVLDPTIRRCMDYSLRDGYSQVLICNLFALRSTDPRALYAHDCPEGDHNLRTIHLEALYANTVVLAWGNHGTLNGQAQRVLALLHNMDVQPKCLKVNAGGSPAHPLYLKRDLPFIDYIKR